MAIALVLGLLAALGAHADEPPALQVFTRPGCPHCAQAEAFLAELEARRPLRIARHDVSREPAALERLIALAAEAGIQPGVPAFYAHGRLLVGFRDADTTGRALEALLFAGAPAPSADAVDIPLLGRLRAGDLGLPLFTLVVGLLDGFNPCAMWVLLFLLSLLAHLRSRRRMFQVGGVFVAVSGLVYYAFLAAWLGAFLWMGLARPIQVGLGALAFAMGALHVKDAVAPGRGPSLHIPAAARPRIYARVRGVLSAENLPAALVAVAVLALFVNLVELLCTAGLPALYTHVLSLHELSTWRYHAYLALYVAAYVFDDALVLALAVATLGTRRLSQAAVRRLDLLSGTMLMALGALLALRPQWLMRLVV
jgi:glutaredoxin